MKYRYVQLYFNPTLTIPYEEDAMLTESQLQYKRERKAARRRALAPGHRQATHNSKVYQEREVMRSAEREQARHRARLRAMREEARARSIEVGKPQRQGLFRRIFRRITGS